MKKIFLFLSSFVIFLNIDTVYGHSGRTDSSGCHNDNIHGGYHCHNGGNNGGYNDSGYNAQSDYDKGFAEGYEIAYGHTSKGETYTWEWNGSQAYGQGFEDGIAAGNTDGEEVFQRQIEQWQQEEYNYLEEDSIYEEPYYEDNSEDTKQYDDFNEKVIYEDEETQSGEDSVHTEDDIYDEEENVENEDFYKDAEETVEDNTEIPISGKIITSSIISVFFTVLVYNSTVSINATKKRKFLFFTTLLLAFFIPILILFFVF